MTEITSESTKAQALSWRNPAIRSAVFQIATLVLLALGAYYIIQNTVANLDKRGIASGFSFLIVESGFAISEVMPVPQLEPGFVTFMGSIAPRQRRPSPTRRRRNRDSGRRRR